MFVFLLVFAVGGPSSADDKTVAKGPLGFWLETRSKTRDERHKMRFVPNFFAAESLFAVA